MTHLPSEAKFLTGGRCTLRHHGELPRKLGNEGPDDNRQMENAVAEARYSVDARAQEIKFNAFLQTGFATGKTVTAHFTRKSKPDSA